MRAAVVATPPPANTDKPAPTPRVSKPKNSTKFTPRTDPDELIDIVLELEHAGRKVFDTFQWCMAGESP